MLSLILLLVSIFLIPIQGTIVDLSILAGYFVFTLLLVVSSGIPLLKVLKGLRPILFLLTFTVLIQILIIRPTTLDAISDTFTFYLSFTSLAAIILWIIFYQISKKWIKFKVLYFILSVIVVFALQYVLPYGAIYQYDVTLYEETVIRALFIFFRIVVIIMLTSLLTFTTMTTDINDGLEGILFPLKKLIP